jgi:broad specificity phosphatase PhoE
MTLEFVLVRHALTRVEEDFPITTWGLTRDGIAASEDLAAMRVIRDADVVYSSSQTKAIETMMHLAKPNHIPMRVSEGITEITSFTLKFFREPEYSANYDGFFGGRLERIAGGESSSEALRRFEQALDTIALTECGARKVCIVSHGAILSFFTAKHTGWGVNDIQQRIAMPDIAVFDWHSKSFKLCWGELERRRATRPGEPRQTQL